MGRSAQLVFLCDDRMASINSTVLADMLRESMQNGQTPNLTLTSNSMSPLLKSGDMVAIQPVTNSNLQPGTILTFIDDRDTTQLLTHRYWGTGHSDVGEQIITRGDRPLLFDPAITPEKIVGMVNLRQRNGRILNLHTGRGQWLNWQLARSAALELKWLTGIDSLHSPNLLLETAVSNQRALLQQQKISVKIIRRGINLINKILTTSIGLIAAEVAQNR